MSLPDYVPVGGIFTSKKGKMYEAVAVVNNDQYCNRCAFLNKLKCLKVSCYDEERDDKTSVMFIRRKDLEATKPETTKKNSDV